MHRSKEESNRGWQSILQPNSVKSGRPFVAVGLRDGLLVDISQAERGLACSCVCVACEEPLVAKKGEVLIHHFAHASGVECGYAAETLIHWLAKDFLSSTRALTVPPVYAHPGNIIAPYTDILFETISLERPFGEVVPDVTATTASGRKLLVEIAVTHKAEQQKIQKLAVMNLSAVEIPLPEMDVLTLDVAKRIFTSTGARKYWLFNAKAGARRRELFGADVDGEDVTYVCIENYYSFFPERVVR